MRKICSQLSFPSANFFILATGLFALFGSCYLYADIVLGGPGVVPGSQIATRVPFKNSVTLPGSYKFIFSGIQAKGNTAGAPGSSGTNGNGGQFHVSATVSATGHQKVKEGKLEFRDVQEFNTAPTKTLLIIPAEVFRATTTPITIKLEWAGQGNAHKPNASFNILGEYQQAPPPPTGSLHFPHGEWMLNPSGAAHPEGIATIVRE